MPDDKSCLIIAHRSIPEEGDATSSGSGPLPICVSELYLEWMGGPRDAVPTDEESFALEAYLRSGIFLKTLSTDLPESGPLCACEESIP
jgi:hypothetical protein